MTDLPLEFHRDKQGVAKAVWSGGNEGQIVARFFESELAADTAYCARLIAEAEKHLHGQPTAWSTNGNSFAVAIDGKKVILRPLFGSEQSHLCRIELSEFLSLLHKWHALIK